MGPHCLIPRLTPKLRGSGWHSIGMRINVWIVGTNRGSRNRSSYTRCQSNIVKIVISTNNAGTLQKQ